MYSMCGGYGAQILYEAGNMSVITAGFPMEGAMTTLMTLFTADCAHSNYPVSRCILMYVWRWCMQQWCMWVGVRRRYRL